MPDPEKVEASSETGGGNPSLDVAAHEEEDDFAKNKRHEEIQSLKLANQKLSEEIQGLKNDNAGRQLYANRIFCLVAVWLGAIFVIMLLQGALGKDGMPFDWSLGLNGPRVTWVWHFDLPPEVLLALIGGTTASVLGIFTFVAQYLFPKHG